VESWIVVRGPWRDVDGGKVVKSKIGTQ
jgi:hypothetical protein